MKTTLVKRALPETAASVHMSVDLINFTTKKDLLRSNAPYSASRKRQTLQIPLSSGTSLSDKNKKTKNRPSMTVCFWLCVRQNLVFKALFVSVSDDKCFLLPHANKKRPLPVLLDSGLRLNVSWISIPHLNWNSISCYPSTFMQSIKKGSKKPFRPVTLRQSTACPVGFSPGIFLRSEYRLNICCPESYHPG